MRFVVKYLLLEHIRRPAPDFTEATLDFAKARNPEPTLLLNPGVSPCESPQYTYRYQTRRSRRAALSRGEPADQGNREGK